MNRYFLLIFALCIIARPSWSSRILKAHHSGLIHRQLDSIHYRFWNRQMGVDTYVALKDYDFKVIANKLYRNGFDPKKDTKITIHGFASSSSTTWRRGLSHAYFDANLDVNLLIVDWSWKAISLQASSSVEQVGQLICNHLIQALIELNVNPSKIHIISYSLGTHVAGNVGRCMQGQIRRITALDPIDLSFKFITGHKMLKKSDAVFVDVIHTSSGHLTEGCVGTVDNLGHVDFWPNLASESLFFGRLKPHNQHQPGCVDASCISIQCMLQEIFRGVCSHERSWSLYIESIRNPNAFESRPCKEWEEHRNRLQIVKARKCIEAEGPSSNLHMGEHLDVAKALNNQDSYYLTTTDGANGQFSKEKFELP